MNLQRLLSQSVLFVAFLTPTHSRCEAVGEDDGLLTVRARVVMPDGSPAAGAVVTSLNVPGTRSILAIADENGVAEIRDVFPYGGQIHASSVDGKFQTTWTTSDAETRLTAADSIKLELTPANSRKITVLADGAPVAGAHVLVYGTFIQRGVTDSNGEAELWLPVGKTILKAAAWHPELGVAGTAYFWKSPTDAELRLSLKEVEPMQLLVVDEDDAPVADFELEVSFSVDRKTFPVSEVRQSTLTTDEQGIAIADWAPAGGTLTVIAKPIDNAWRVASVEHSGRSERQRKVRLIRMHELEGQVVMPAGANAEGLLVRSIGVSPAGVSSGVDAARVRRDGSFSLRIAQGHGYVLGLVDCEWAADLWSGVVLPNGEEKPEAIELVAVPAAPVTISVSRGPDRQPIELAHVQVYRHAAIDLGDSAGVGQYLTSFTVTNALSDYRGVVRTGVASGEVHIQFGIGPGEWSAERELFAKAGEPLDVRFHRSWFGERLFRADITYEGNPYTPSDSATIHAWIEGAYGAQQILSPTVTDSGAIEVSVDTEAIDILVVDQEQTLSGVLRLGPDEIHDKVQMRPMASYVGTLLDQSDEPLAGRELKLVSVVTSKDVTQPQTTDKQGRFRFSGIPAGILLRPKISNDFAAAEYSLNGYDLTFEPGEHETSAVLRPRRKNPSGWATDRPLAAQVDAIARNASASGVYGLLVLEGDDAPATRDIASRLCDGRQTPALYLYRMLRVNAAKQAAETPFLTSSRWPTPRAGQVSLVVLGANRGPLATTIISTADRELAVATGQLFIAQQAPPNPDAEQQLAIAQKNAAATGRKVWITFNYPQAWPCVLLGRWIAEHRAALSKDYVIVELKLGDQPNSNAIYERLPVKWNGVAPWYAIMTPEGEVLATSDTRVGNIGMPSLAASKKHFRDMLESTAERLTDEEIEELVASLDEQE